MRKVGICAGGSADPQAGRRPIDRQLEGCEDYHGKGGCGVVAQL